MRAANVLTTREAALKLGVSIRRLMALLAEGKLPGSYKVGLIWQIPQKAIETRFREKEVSFARRKR
jgi:excisionase family DNA binding protein